VGPRRDADLAATPDPYRYSRAQFCFRLVTLGPTVGVRRTARGRGALVLMGGGLTTQRLGTVRGRSAVMCRSLSQKRRSETDPTRSCVATLVVQMSLAGTRASGLDHSRRRAHGSAPHKDSAPGGQARKGRAKARTPPPSPQPETGKKSLHHNGFRPDTTPGRAVRLLWTAAPRR
jgi:hypothetical protein